MEKIKIPEIIFKYSWIYDQNWKAVGERLSMEIEHLSQEDIRGYMKKVEKSWKENERDILEELSKITSLSWKSESITCYVVKRCFMPSAFSDPLTISVLTHKKEDEFVDILTHELIHRLLTEPGRRRELENYHKLKEEKYPGESLKEMQDYEEKLRLLEIGEDSLSRAFSAEYTLNVNILDDGFSEEMIPFTSRGEVKRVNAFIEQTSFFFKPNETKKELAKFYAPSIEMNFEESKEIHELPFYSSPTSTSLAIETFKGNVVGKILNSAVIVAVVPGEQLNVIRKVNLKNKTLRTILALNVYEKEYGDLPEELEELVPEYLSQVPKDPFYEDRNIQYSREERVIYSLQKEEVREGRKDDYIFDF